MKAMTRLFTLVFTFGIWLFAISIQAEEGTDLGEVTWKNSELAQLEQLTPGMKQAFDKMDRSISSVAVSDITFDTKLSQKFRETAIGKLFQILGRNPRLRVSRCDECQQIRSYVSGSFLKISRGIADDEYRRELASRMNVQGFMKIQVLENNNQISVIFEIYEAKDGKVVFSEILTAPPEPETIYYTAFFGKAMIPVNVGSTSVDHSSQIYGISRTTYISKNWSATGVVAIYSDTTNENLSVKLSDEIAGVKLEANLNWTLFSLGQENTKFQLTTGLGQLYAPIIDSPFIYSAGITLLLGQQIGVGIYQFGTSVKNLSVSDETTDGSFSGGTTLMIGVLF